MVIVAEPDHGVAQVLKARRLIGVAVLAFREVVRWPVHIHDRSVVVVREVRARVALLDQYLGTGREAAPAAVEKP
jgi:hypothetical protein